MRCGWLKHMPNNMFVAHVLGSGPPAGPPGSQRPSLIVLPPQGRSLLAYRGEGPHSPSVAMTLTRLHVVVTICAGPPLRHRTTSA